MCPYVHREHDSPTLLLQGKSCFVNALLGGDYVKEGVLPTTAQITVLKYGQAQGVIDEGNDVVSMTLPVPWLQDVWVVDTPGAATAWGEGF